MPRGPRRRAPVSIDASDEPERHRRTQRRIERKVNKVMAATHGGYAGPSIIEILEAKLLAACVRYLELGDGHPSKQTQRGVVRGMAEGVAVMRNPYLANRRMVIKAIEREFITYARSERVV